MLWQLPRCSPRRRGTHLVIAAARLHQVVQAVHVQGLAVELGDLQGGAGGGINPSAWAARRRHARERWLVAAALGGALQKQLFWDVDQTSMC